MHNTTGCGSGAFAPAQQPAAQVRSPRERYVTWQFWVNVIGKWDEEAEDEDALKWLNIKHGCGSSDSQ